MAEIDPQFPIQGERPWGNKLNAALGEMVEQGNASDAQLSGRLSPQNLADATAAAATAAVAPVVEVIESGRLSVGDLAATISAVTASDAANPETELNGAIIDVVDGVLGGGTAGMLRIVDARGNTNTPRPSGYLGSVLWKINEGESNPLNYNSALGDILAEVETTPVPFDPSQIPGVIAWLDGPSLVGTYTQGQELVSWPNLVDGYPDALPIIADVGPTFAAAAINSGPGVLFNGVNGGVKIAGLAPYTGPVTIYLVAISTPGTTTGTDFFYDGISSTVAQLQMGLGRTAANLWILYAGDSFTKTGANNTLHLFKAEYGNPTSTLKVGGTSQSGTTNDGPAIIGFTLGSRGDGANVLDGAIGMWVAVQGTVSAEVDTQMVAYALAKHGAS